MTVVQRWARGEERWAMPCYFVPGAVVGVPPGGVAMGASGAGAGGVICGPKVPGMDKPDDGPKTPPPPEPEPGRGAPFGNVGNNPGRMPESVGMTNGFAGVGGGMAAARARGILPIWKRLDTLIRQGRAERGAGETAGFIGEGFVFFFRLVPLAAIFINGSQTEVRLGGHEVVAAFELHMGRFVIFPGLCPTLP